MKTEAMRRFVGIDKTGSESSKAMKIAKTVGHGVESVSCNISMFLLILISNFSSQVVYRLPIPFVGRVVSLLNKPVSTNTTKRS